MTPMAGPVTITLGRIIRERDLNQFSTDSPLAGRNSDWLLAASVDTAAGLTLSSRSAVFE